MSDEPQEAYYPISENTMRRIIELLDEAYSPRVPYQECQLAMANDALLTVRETIVAILDLLPENAVDK